MPKAIRLGTIFILVNNVSANNVPERKYHTPFVILNPDECRDEESSEAASVVTKRNLRSDATSDLDPSLSLGMTAAEKTKRNNV